MSPMPQPRPGSPRVPLASPAGSAGPAQAGSLWTAHVGGLASPMPWLWAALELFFRTSGGLLWNLLATSLPDCCVLAWPASSPWARGHCGCLWMCHVPAAPRPCVVIRPTDRRANPQNMQYCCLPHLRVAQSKCF